MRNQANKIDVTKDGEAKTTIMNNTDLDIDVIMSQV